MSNNALYESFDNGVGALSNAWNIDTSTRGEVKLSGYASMMEWASGRDAGHGYGTYTVNAKVEGNQPGAGIILWPGDNNWPGQEIDMVEITPDGSGRQYGTVHWNAGGGDAYNPLVFDGVYSGWHTYQMTWEAGKISFSVDGSYKGSVTDHVPTDYDHGGMNNTIGFLNNNPNTSITVSDVSFSPSGGGSSWTPAPAYVEAAPIQLAAETAPAAAPAATGATDWEALAAQVLANYEATGSWFI